MWTFIAVAVLIAATLFFLKVRSGFQQTHATNLMVGTELDSNGQVMQSNNDISSDADLIYLSFDFVTLRGAELPVTVDWVANGKIIHSTMESMRSGKIVQSTNRKQLGLAEFPKGVYEINIHMGYAPFASASFTVK